MQFLDTQVMDLFLAKIMIYTLLIHATLAEAVQLNSQQLTTMVNLPITSQAIQLYADNPTAKVS